jgi:hypothetical protein
MSLFSSWRLFTCGLLITSFNFLLPLIQDKPTTTNYFSNIFPSAMQLADAVYGNSYREYQEQTTNHSIRILRRARGSNHTVTVIRFDYTAGTASRVVADENSGEMLQEQKLPGRPQSSRQEFEAAVLLIRQDPNLSNLITGGAVPEGGFIVDGPEGHPIRDRYIQIRLLSPNRLTLLRIVLVDLTARVVASARTTFE